MKKNIIMICLVFSFMSCNHEMNPLKSGSTNIPAGHTPPKDETEVTPVPDPVPSPVADPAPAPFLSNFSLSVGLDQSFDENQVSGYSKSVPCERSATTVNAISGDSSFDLELQVGSEGYGSLDSSVDSEVKPLYEGSNQVNVKVTNEDGVSKIYSATVTRVSGGIDCEVVGKWDLDEADPAAQALDLSPNSYDLDNGAAAAAGQTTSHSGTSFLFDGIDDYLYAEIGTPPINKGEITVAAWVYPLSLPLSGAAHIAGFIQGDGGSTHDKNLIIDSNGKARFYVYCENSFTVFTDIPTETVPLNAWTHLAGVVDGINVYLYMNGVRVASTSCASTYSSYSQRNIIIGGTTAFAQYGGYYFHGYIDEVGIWGRGFNEGEMDTLYNNGF